MNANMNKGFYQVAAFQKFWTDSIANMTSVWSQFSPSSPPADEIGSADHTSALLYSDANASF
jgi:hypothetical protein